MSVVFIRQDAQVASTTGAIKSYLENVTLNLANFETDAADLVDDLNNLRSAVNYARHTDQTLNWYDQQTVPTALETGTTRGTDQLNDGLHAVEKKRVLRCVYTLSSITIASAGNTFDILGTGELPAQTTAAVGVVTTLGTVVADHNAAFGAHSLLEVAGPTAISPKNLVQIVDAGSRDPVLDAGDRIYGLLQSETAADGHTITTTTTTRVQISFVKVNGTGDDLIAITAGAMDGVSYDYCYVERVRLEDIDEADFLDGANVQASATVDADTHKGLDQLVHEIAESSFDEYIYTGSRLTTQTTWTDAGKTIKVREVVFTYTTGRISQIVTTQRDGAGSVVETLTDAYTYSANRVVSVTRTLT